MHRAPWTAKQTRRRQWQASGENGVEAWYLWLAMGLSEIDVRPLGQSMVIGRGVELV